MNNEQTDHLQNQIDRLVDGDFAKSELRQMLVQLDASQEGWKRCALTFIEAQWLQRTFRSLAEGDNRASVRTPVVMQPPMRSRRRRLAAASWMAVAFLLGVGLMWFLQPQRDDQHGPRNIVSEKKDHAPKTPPDSRPPKNNENTEPSIFGVVRVTTNGVTETVIPIVNTKKDEIAAVDVTATELTEYDLHRWERKGYEIEQHRKLVSIQMADGKGFHFPVNWVQYRYVGHRVY